MQKQMLPLLIKQFAYAREYFLRSIEDKEERELLARSIKVVPYSQILVNDEIVKAPLEIEIPQSVLDKRKDEDGNINFPELDNFYTGLVRYNNGWEKHFILTLTDDKQIKITLV